MRVEPERSEGFTLVELLVVIAILSAIAAIAVPAYSKHIARSKAIVTLAAAKDALKYLAQDTGAWPGGHAPFVCPKNLTPSVDGQEYADLTADDIGIFNNNGSVFAGAAWEGPYLPASYLAPDGRFLDPWGTPYFIDYDYEVDGKWFVVIGSSGPNKSAVNVYDSDNIYVILGE